MRWNLRLLLFAVLFSAVAVAAPDRQAELKQLEDVWDTAHMRGDTGALDRLWHEDLLVIVPRMPVMSKQKTLAFVRSGRMTFQRYETSELNIRIYGKMALVMGRLQRSRMLDGHQVDDNWRFTKVYLRDGHGWRVVSFQASEMAGQP